MWKKLQILAIKTGKIKADLICLVGEVFDESKDMKLFDPNAPWKKTTLPGGSYTLRELLVPVFQKGECVYESPSVMDIQRYCTREKDTIWEFLELSRCSPNLSRKEVRSSKLGSFFSTQIFLATRVKKETSFTVFPA